MRADSQSGLSADEAVRRLQDGGPNLLPGSEPRSPLRILASVLLEPMFLMLLAAGGIYLLLGDRAEAIFLLGFVIVVIGITLFQERRTERALTVLRDLSAPRACVVRDGVEARIPARQVVRGDLLVVREGDRIAADAVVIEGRLSVDESLLTGESVPVEKTPGDPAGGMPEPGSECSCGLYASTVATRGTALAVVLATGGATAVGHIGKSLAQAVAPLSPLQRASRRLVRWVSVGAIATVVALVLLKWLWISDPLLESLLAGIALAMAILPEEIPVILSVFLALGAWRIAKNRVLARQVPAVETLGAITVLAVDKTGTLTLNRMRAARLCVEGEFHDCTTDAEPPETFHALIEFAMLATPTDPFDPMERAIQDYGHAVLAGTEHVHDDLAPEYEYPLSADILAMTRVYSAAQPEQHALATKGAPEAVVDLCHLAEDRHAQILSWVETMAQDGMRVLGVAHGRWRGSASDPGWPPSQHDHDFTFLGLVGFVDPPRPEVQEAIALARDAGIRVMMLTGDHPATARAIARQVGIAEQADVLLGPEIATLDDTALATRLRSVDVCARLHPEQKLRLVHTLQQAGHVVAMTGDGVNDAPALKAADVGIAMGERGADVAREAAALVLLDDSFASIVGAIRQGRRIDDNVGKATHFVFAVHLPIVAMAMVPVVLDWPPLLLPVHIVLLQLLIDPTCSLYFEAEPEEPDVMHRPPRSAKDRAFSRENLSAALVNGLGVATIMLGTYAILHRAGWGPSDLRLTNFVGLVLALFPLVLAGRYGAPAIDPRRLRNPWLPYIVAGIGATVGVTLLVPSLRTLMGFSDFSARIIWPALGIAVGAWAWLTVARALTRKWR